MDSEMSGDWIKLEHSTPDKPEIFRIAETLSIAPEHALGCLIRVWMWADQQIANGNGVNVTETIVDRIARVAGFGSAMTNAGWLTVTSTGIEFPNFNRHNGQTAKTRALTAKRVAKCKAEKGNAAVTTDALPREEKRREDQEAPIAPTGARETKPDNGYCQSFLDWWERYPKKSGKEAAFKAWTKAGGKIRKRMICSSQEAAAYLLKVVTAYAEARKTEDPQFTLNPATWLNQGHYDDDQATWRKQHPPASSRVADIPTGGTPVFNAETGEIVLAKEAK